MQPKQWGKVAQVAKEKGDKQREVYHLGRNGETHEKGSTWQKNNGWATNWNDTGETFIVDKYESVKGSPKANLYGPIHRKKTTWSLSTPEPEDDWIAYRAESPLAKILFIHVPGHFLKEFRLTALEITIVYSINKFCWYDKTSKKTSSTSEHAVEKWWKHTWEKSKNVKNTLWQRSFTNKSLTSQLPHLQVS